MSLLEIDRVHKAYGTGPAAVTAVEDVTLTARPGDMLCIVGPSGCGKTTLLRCISGLLPPTSGTVTVDDCTLVAPGTHAAVTVELCREVALDTGLDFAVREGNRTIGAGTVTAVDGPA